jgi:hypothetical protein
VGGVSTLLLGLSPQALRQPGGTSAGCRWLAREGGRVFALPLFRRRWLGLDDGS